VYAARARFTATKNSREESTWNCITPKDILDGRQKGSMPGAIKSDLGLELQSRKGPVTTVVIERIERPTEN